MMEAIVPGPVFSLSSFGTVFLFADLIGELIQQLQTMPEGRSKEILEHEIKFVLRWRQISKESSNHNFTRA